MNLLGRFLQCIPRSHPTRVVFRCGPRVHSRDKSVVSSNTDDRTNETPSVGAFYSLPDPVFDNTDEHFFEPSKRAPVRQGSHVLDSNWEPMFFGLDELYKPQPEEFDPDEDVKHQGLEGAGEEIKSPLHHLPIPFNRLNTLFRYPLLTRRVVQQTGKGKMDSQYALVLVGNCDGLVGVGEGKAENAQQASEKAFGEAVRNMDYVERFEGRTLWTDIDTKFGATRLLMRPRPVGFGLMCAPGIHQVLKAAGIKDASVKIWGSRNKINVIKATIRVLHAGHAPLAMGNGIGGRARRLEAGSGMRGKMAVERERGRRILDARTW